MYFDALMFVSDQAWMCSWVQMLPLGVIITYLTKFPKRFQTIVEESLELSIYAAGVRSVGAYIMSMLTDARHAREPRASDSDRGERRRGSRARSNQDTDNASHSEETATPSVSSAHSTATAVSTAAPVAAPRPQTALLPGGMSWAVRLKMAARPISAPTPEGGERAQLPPRNKKTSRPPAMTDVEFPAIGTGLAGPGESPGALPAVPPPPLKQESSQEEPLSETTSSEDTNQSINEVLSASSPTAFSALDPEVKLSVATGSGGLSRSVSASGLTPGSDTSLSLPPVSTSATNATGSFGPRPPVPRAYSGRFSAAPGAPVYGSAPGAAVPGESPTSAAAADDFAAADEVVSSTNMAGNMGATSGVMSWIPTQSHAAFSPFGMGMVRTTPCGFPQLLSYPSRTLCTNMSLREPCAMFQVVDDLGSRRIVSFSLSPAPHALCVSTKPLR